MAIPKIQNLISANHQTITERLHQCFLKNIKSRVPLDTYGVQCLRNFKN